MILKKLKELEQLIEVPNVDKEPHKAIAAIEMLNLITKIRGLVKNLNIPAVSNLLCGTFEPDNKTSSATKCKCGREKWEHPKAT